MPTTESDKASEESSSGSSASIESISAPETPVGKVTQQCPYSELGDGQVMEILSKHLEHFQNSCSSKKDANALQSRYGGIVLHREAIEHCARIYRIMVS